MCEHATFHLYILPTVSIFIFNFAIINDAIVNILVAVSLHKSLVRVSLEKWNCRVVECVCDETKHTATPVHSPPTSRILVGPVTCFHRQTLPPDGRSCLYSWALSKPPAWPTPFALYGPSFSLGPRSLSEKGCQPESLSMDRPSSREKVVRGRKRQSSFSLNIVLNVSISLVF